MLSMFAINSDTILNAVPALAAAYMVVYVARRLLRARAEKHR